MCALFRRVTLYAKDGCHLCEQTWAQLQAFQGQMDIVLEKVDITSSPELLQRFGHFIPVVDIQGGAMLYAPISALQLHSALSLALAGAHGID